ncbi:hypothetical protein [Roseobacter sp. S98]|uniref:hypothetical protein n=1 Tax=Roseobacter algicola (ex Choi et al. 2025) (nom. illeg.) TaxID=3092138 RepID=UPI0035C7512D
MYKIMFVDPDDAATKAEVLAFVSEKSTGGIRAREDWVLEKAIRTGEVLIMRQGQRLAGVSFVYEFQDLSNKTASFLEMGTMLIPDAEDNGYRLQEMIAVIHMFNMAYMNDRWPIVFAVVEDNTASAHILTKYVKMKRWEPVEDLCLLREQSGTPFNPNKTTLIAERAAILAALSKIESLLIEENRLRSNKNNVEIEVDVHPINTETLRIARSGG